MGVNRMADREQIREQMKQGGVDFILAQFVDIHGSAKVKMVPASCLDDMIDDGAGFAGAAVWGVDFHLKWKCSG